MSTFSERLRTLIDGKKISQQDIVNRLGFHKSQVSKWMSGNVGVPRRATLQKLSDYFGCNIEWLATGKGEPFLQGSSHLPTSVHISESRSSKASSHGDILDNEFTLIPKYRARLSGGHGSFETSDMIEANMAFRTEFLRRNGNPKRMALFEVSGDSMTPFIHHGDVILVDLQQDDPATIVDGKAYAFREDHTVKVKRLSVQGRNLIATSEDSRQYPPYQIDESNFTLIGRVIWVGHEVR